MTDYALFKDNTQVSKARATQGEVMAEAIETGAAYRGAPDFIGDNTSCTVGMHKGYSIREIVDG